jgi:hypothetical protein
LGGIFSKKMKNLLKNCFFLLDILMEPG